MGFRFLGLLLLLLPVALRAQLIKPELLTIEQGLSQGMIFDLQQTRDGFLWLATKDGLNRYDGYNFTVFGNSPLDSFSLVQNTATTLLEDSRGWLWVGTESGNLDVYDAFTGRFHHFNLPTGFTNKALLSESTSMAEAPDGSVWILRKGSILTRIGLPKFRDNRIPPQADLTRLAQITTCSFQLVGGAQPGFPEWLLSFQLQSSTQVTVTSTYGIYNVLLEPQGARVLNYTPLPYANLSALITPGSSGSEVWGVGFDTHHIYRWRNGQVTRFKVPFPQRLERVEIHVDQNNDLWLAVDQALWRIQPNQQNFNFSEPDWTLDHLPTCLITDRNSNFWVGTVGYGLRKFNPRKKLFHTGANGNTVWGLWRDAQGRFFCKIFNKIHPYDPQTGRVEFTQPFPNASSRLFDLVPEASGACWLLGREEEENGQAILQHTNRNGVVEQRFPFKFNAHPYARLLASRSGALWMTGANCQLVRFDPATAGFTYFDYTHLFGDDANGIRAFAVAEDYNGVIWIGTQQGLVKVTTRGESLDFELFKAKPGDTNGLTSNSIAALWADPSGVLWIATKGGGINIFDLRTHEVQHITTADGLPNNVVYGILPEAPPPPLAPPSGGKPSFLPTGRNDGKGPEASPPVGASPYSPPTGGAGGAIWCSTNRGLARLQRRPDQPDVFNITTFTAAKGLQDNEFNTQAFSQTPDGELLFGGINGLNHFHPLAIALDTTLPPVKLVGLEINHKPATFGGPDGLLSGPPEHLRELVLEYNQNNVSFEFAALDFTDPAQNRYRYKLEGLDADWVDNGSKHFAHFNHLAPGSYKFWVQGSNGEGAWSTVPHPLIVVVRPPWWFSNWAYACYVLVAALLLWQAYRFWLRRLQMKQQLEFEHRETERVKALEQLKTEFFGNVTHEFRTPLTLMLEPLRQLRANPRDPALPDKLALLERNSQRLLTLVNQLLDLAKLEHSGGMQLDLRSADVAATVQSTLAAFLNLAEKKNVTLRYEGPASEPPTFFDPEKVELVLNNLLSNALKFTPPGGEITLALSAQPSAVRPMVQITVQDTGVGMSEETLARIFDRFYQAAPPGPPVGGEGDVLPNQGHQSPQGVTVLPLTEGGGAGWRGTGIGLALSKELAALMGGSLSARSETGRGAVFTFEFPYNPAQTADPVPTNVPLVAAAASPAETELPVVLVVEDNADIRELIRLSLAGQWQVHEAPNGEEGIRQAVALVPDLVISDLMMPLKDGYEVCNALKANELTAHIPVILLTAKSALDSKIKGLRTGADDYLTKPFNAEELRVRMDNLVATRRRLRQLFGPVVSTDQAEGYEEKPFLSAPDNDFLRRFTTVIEEHLDNETLGVEDFAAKMFVSRVQLHRKLKGLSGRTATDFIRDYRLERAMLLLKQREGRVGEVALRVGFGNEKYFSTAFKEKFGVSPSQV